MSDPGAPPRESFAPSGYSGPRPPGAGGARLAPAGSVATATAGPQFRLAGWWRRVGAALIDFAIVGTVSLVILVPLGIGAFGAGTDGGFIAALLGVFLVALVLVVVGFAYAPVMMASTNGRTVGRMATGIRVVRTSGQPMDFTTAALREVVLKGLLINTIASSLTLGLATLLDVLWPLWDEEKRALHDFPVNTRTVMA